MTVTERHCHQIEINTRARIHARVPCNLQGGYFGVPYTEKVSILFGQDHTIIQSEQIRTRSPSSNAIIYQQQQQQQQSQTENQTELNGKCCERDYCACNFSFSF